MTKLYVSPKNEPPSREDYDHLYAQLVAVILATGKVSITVPHSIKHPLNPSAGVLVIAKQVDSAYTTYTVEAEP